MVGKAQPLELHDDVAVAQPADDEIVVKVGVISLNPVDYKLLDYDFFDGKNPKTLSHDAAGVVVAVGKTASGTFAVGDRVVTSPKIDGPGTASQFVTVSSEKTVKVADACSLAAASTLGIAWLSACM
jgi:NADPH:quinone reductase-like Zn-dependent oxidoreductase